MANAEQSVSNIRGSKSKTKYELIRQEIEELDRRLSNKVRELREELQEIEQANLVSTKRAAEILGISEDAVRKRADSGTLTKRNADGSKKITNRRTPVFFDEQEVRNKI